MFVLITYDVNIISPGGDKRLRKVARVCVDHGKRVQNSVFECSVTDAQLTMMKHDFHEIIDKENDSIRIYHLGSNRHCSVETIGKDNGLDFNGDLII